MKEMPFDVKLLHLADLHLGKRLNEQSLLEDQRYILGQITEIAAQHRVDAVLICGDVYDKRVPNTDAVALLDAFLTDLVRQRHEVFVISGNHDSAARLHFGSRLMAASGLHVVGTFDGAMSPVTLQDDYGPVHLWSLPFVRITTVAHYFPQADMATYDEAIATVLGAAAVNVQERNILLAHQFVAGGTAPQMAGSEGTFGNVGTVDQVSARLFEPFDYVALGHIHRAQQAGHPYIRYAGSPLKYSFSEVGQEKSVTLLTLADKGSVVTELIPLRPLREMRHIRGPIDTLLAPENAQNRQDYIYATLTDTVPVLDAMARVRAAYPNALHLDYAGTEGRDTERLLADVASAKGRTLVEHFEAFYALQQGQAPSAEILRILSEVAGDVQREEGL